LETRETISRVFRVLGKDHNTKFLEFSGHSRVGTSGGAVKKHYSFGVATQFSKGVDYYSHLDFVYSSPGAYSLHFSSLGDLYNSFVSKQILLIKIG